LWSVFLNLDGMRRLDRLPLLGCAALFVLGGCGDEGSHRTAGLVQERGTEAAASDEGAGPLVVFLGDSIASGLNLEAREASHALPQRELAEEGVPFRLINAGVSGDTSAGGLRRIDWLLKQDPDWVVIELGGNDGLRGVALDAIEANLRAIVARVQGAGARVLLLGMCLPANYGQDYITGFLALYERIAREAELPFVPCFLEGVGGVSELNQPDGIHPTAEGQRRLAEKLAPVLRELLTEER